MKRTTSVIWAAGVLLLLLPLGCAKVPHGTTKPGQLPARSAGGQPPQQPAASASGAQNPASADTDQLPAPAGKPQAGSSTTGGGESGRPSYLVTVMPLKLILDPLVATRARVDVLIPPGASVHMYEPAPSDVQKAAQANALFWVGKDFDGWAAGLGARQSIEMLSMLPQNALIIAAQPSGETPAADSGAASKTAGLEPDPHFFTDPMTVRLLLPALVAKLSALDPEGARAYQLNGDAFSTKLDQISQELAGVLGPAGGQATLLMHPSFTYLFKSYGIRLAGVLEPFPGQEPSPKDIENLVRLVKQDHIRAIFTETLLPHRPAEVLAEAAGVPLLELDPSCGASATAYPNYRAWLLHNAQVLRQGLGK